MLVLKTNVARLHNGSALGALLFLFFYFVLTFNIFFYRKREPEKIARAAERFPNVHVGNFTFKPDTLKLGVLKGNR